MRIARRYVARLKIDVTPPEFYFIVYTGETQGDALRTLPAKTPAAFQKVTALSAAAD